MDSGATHSASDAHGSTTMVLHPPSSTQRAESRFNRLRRKFIHTHESQLYLLVLPVVVYFFVFHYIPMYGVQIAFRRYRITRGITESPCWNALPRPLSLDGVVNVLIRAVGLDPVYFMGSNFWFRHILVFSWAWQHTGYQAIIFLAALTSVDPSLYEAAAIDGASKLQKILYIDIPGIMPTVAIMLLLRVGRMLNVDFQKALLMQTALNLDASEIIGTYVYKTGLINAQFSYSTAVNLFQTLINLVLIITVNRVSKRVTNESLW